MNTLILLGAAIVAGIVGGMGMGGGVILIPCLCFFAGMEQRAAQTINLIYYIPMAAVALITHIRHKNIDVKAVKNMLGFGLLGAVAGALLASRLDQAVLRKMFGYFMLAVGMYELFRNEHISEKSRE